MDIGANAKLELVDKADDQDGYHHCEWVNVSSGTVPPG